MATMAVMNGTVVTGDGATIIEAGSVIIEGDRIQEVIHGPREAKEFSGIDRIIDASKCIIMPGVINHHTHGIAMCPLYPSAAEPLNRDRVKYNLDKHLVEGTTTLLNVCGFASMEEVEESNRNHPINIKTATSHSPTNFQAAKLADGSGLKEKHLALTVEKMLENGAVAIGEIGAGHTLGGGGQDYLYIPQAIKQETGRLLSTPQARKLKYSILGRKIDCSAFNEDNVKTVLDELDLSTHLTVQRARELVENSVMSSFNAALDGMREAAKLGAMLKVPVLVHNAAASMHVVEEVCRSEAHILADHSNHPTFEVEECVEHARKIKALGKTVDVSSLDMFVAREMCDSPEIIHALMRAKVVDTISTDYGGGLWDSILLVIESVVEEGIVDLAAAIAMTSSNVCTALPLLAPERGLIKKGKMADITMVNQQKISHVEAVIIEGKVVVKGGKPVYSN